LINGGKYRDHWDVKSKMSVIETKNFMLYREIIAICSQIHTKYINTAVWAEIRMNEC